MATETVENQTHNPVHDKESGAPADVKAAATVHEQEKELVASVRPAHERSLNPFVVTERPEDKHLGLSSRTLKLDDFELIKTLGTGMLRSPGKNKLAYPDLIFPLSTQALLPACGSHD